jgi:hypothetical protein
MNERIKQLAEQAEKYADDNFKGEPTYSEAYDSKFAELIVRECGEIAYKTYWDNPLEVRGIHFKEAMYKRFGIKI